MIRFPFAFRFLLLYIEEINHVGVHLNGLDEYLFGVELKIVAKNVIFAFIVTG